MQTWTKDIGTVSLVHGYGVIVAGNTLQRYEWAHRTGKAWPCSTLDGFHRVAATIDRDTGDLIDLVVYRFADDRAPIGPSDMDEYGHNIAGDELTAWIDDNLAGTPFAHLARNVGEAV